MNPSTAKQILGSKSLLVMYRDCLKATPIMNQNVTAQTAIRREFRASFERQRHASEHEVAEFKEGIVRILSNLVIYEVKKQYTENPGHFEGRPHINIHDEADQRAEEEDLAAAGVGLKDPKDLVF